MACVYSTSMFRCTSVAMRKNVYRTLILGKLFFLFKELFIKSKLSSKNKIIKDIEVTLLANFFIEDIRVLFELTYDRFIV
jgi:hypothetical protein